MPSTERHKSASSAVDSLREKLVEAARQGWIDRLIDTSRRNNLLFFRATVGGSIEVPDGNLSLAKLLSGGTVHATSLLPDTQDRPGRILNIARKARENSEEKGLQTLHLGLGFAIWKAEDGGRDYRAPVVLFPLEFKTKGSEYNSVSVSLAGEPTVNPVLLHLLQQRFGVEIAAAELLPELPDTLELPGASEEQETDAILHLYRTALESLASEVHEAPQFRTDSSVVIGNFAFAKMAMVNDLGEAASTLAGHSLIAAIAGDEGARGEMLSEQSDIDPYSLDEHAPETEFCVVEADSSQTCAIDGIVAGQSAVVHGPPGTGKSQTITNLIATLVGKGKTVLFVAEKRAALEVVQRRLQASQLGHLAIDLHGAELSSKKVMERVAETLNAVRHSRQPDCAALHQRFVERRLRLNQHEKRMHTVSPRTGMTLFEMQGKLLALPEEAMSEVRWRGVELANLAPSSRAEVRDLLDVTINLSMRNVLLPKLNTANSIVRGSSS